MTPRQKMGLYWLVAGAALGVECLFYASQPKEELLALSPQNATLLMTSVGILGMLLNKVRDIRNEAWRNEEIDSWVERVIDQENPQPARSER